MRASLPTKRTVTTVVMVDVRELNRFFDAQSIGPFAIDGFTIGDCDAIGLADVSMLTAASYRVTSATCLL